MRGLTIERKEIDLPNEYKYVGQTIAFEDRTGKEITIRTSNAWRNFWTDRIFLKSKMNLGSKIKILEQCVLPSLTYEAQTWAITRLQEEGVREIQNKMKRSIMNIRLRDKVNIAELRKTKKIREYRVEDQKIKIWV